MDSKRRQNQNRNRLVDNSKSHQQFSISFAAIRVAKLKITRAFSVKAYLVQFGVVFIIATSAHQNCTKCFSFHLRVRVQCSQFGGLFRTDATKHSFQTFHKTYAAIPLSWNPLYFAFRCVHMTPVFPIYIQSSLFLFLFSMSQSSETVCSIW